METQADQLPPLERTSATKYQPTPAAARTSNGWRNLRSAHSAATSVTSSRRSRPQWKPPSGEKAPPGSQPNQPSSAPTKTAKSTTETKAKSPASNGRAATLNAKAQSAAAPNTIADQPANAPDEYLPERIESSQAAAARTV